jgi:hypothetical protein
MADQKRPQQTQSRIDKDGNGGYNQAMPLASNQVKQFPKSGYT